MKHYYNSETWCKIKEIKVIDPDGWDRSRIEESWNEFITEEEFDKRVVVSTIQYIG